MDDPNAYIDIPQALGRLDQPSLTKPEQRLRSLQPETLNLQIPETSRCLLFFDRRWMQSLINQLVGKGFSKIQKFNKIGLTSLEHSQFGKVFVALAPWGAPAAVCRIEELRSVGLTNFIILGIGGRLQKDHAAGSLYLIDQAVRDEGTSLHYLKRSIFAHASFKLSNEISRQLTDDNIEFLEGLSWTTDAPYRETLDKFLYWQKKICLTVEMELAALFSVGKYYKFDIAALIIGADQLTVDGWIDCFDDSQIKNTKNELNKFLCNRFISS